MKQDLALSQIFTNGGKIVDIGGGLNIERSDRTRNPAYAKNKQLLNLSSDIEYIVLDKTPTYNPHIVADIRAMPFQDNEVDAFICNRVLECVEEPYKGVDEMLRCLKPGGMAYIEFLFIQGYFTNPDYTDYYRFSRNGVQYLLRNFSHVDISPMCSALTTWLYLAFPAVEKHSTFFDSLRKTGESVRGYQVLAYK